jgi:hypothetical protein
MFLETGWDELVYVCYIIIIILSCGRSFDPVSPKTRAAYPEVWRIWKSNEEIQWVAFGQQGYYIVSTTTSLYASRSDVVLRNYKNGYRIPLRCASFGYAGSWVVVEENGVIRSHGLSDTVMKLIIAGDVRVSPRIYAESKLADCSERASESTRSG